jgi:hypothetical protein
MPDLAHILNGRDLGYLKIVAELWGIELAAPDYRTASAQLLQHLLDPALIQEVLDDLPPDAHTALADLLAHAGRLPWPLFTRRYGEVREMGAGRRDRALPYLKPISPAEVLWYRALVARSFFDTPDGPREFAYLPEDLLPHLPDSYRVDRGPLGWAAPPPDKSSLLLANDGILDHACTLLAALRVGLSHEAIAHIAAGWKEILPGRPFFLSA